MITTLGRQLVRNVLPQKYKKYADDVIPKKVLQKMTTQMSLQDPDGYIDILKNLNDIGQRAVSLYGKDTTITLDDLDAGAQVKNAREKLRTLVHNIVNDDKLTQQQKQQKIVDLGYKYSAKLKDLGVQDASNRKTGIANQIASGSRGNAVQLMQLITGDMLMKDAMNRDIPFLSLTGYADGDSPIAYWASAMSGRKSTYDVQAATGQVGYLSKQATNITHATPISQMDCGTKDTGIIVKANDSQNLGAVLLRPFKNHPAGAVVNQAMISQAQDDDQMMVRSPLTCKSHRGVCARCSGLQENNKFPSVGSYVALTAVKAFTQPLTQAGISCLHPDTLIRMSDNSTKAIKDIAPGDIVLGVDYNGKTAPTKVVRVFHNGIQPVYKHIAVKQDGTKIQLKATMKHKCLLTVQKAGFISQPMKIELGTPAQDKYFYLTGQHQGQLARIISQQFIGDMQTMDIQVQHQSHMFQVVDYQGVSNSKHGSGMGGSKQVDQEGQDQPTGFQSVNRMFQAPKVFPGGAVLAPVDGRITQIRQAPQGGSFITVGNKSIYSPSVRTIKCKVGDVVEAGDMLTNGVPNPAQVVAYKGIGQGRRYYTEKMVDILNKANAGTTRRNVQQFARAMVNKVRITAPQGINGYYPGDIADYDEVTYKWQPREGSKQMNLKEAANKYLEQPILYYSIGTRVTPRVAQKLAKYKIDKVMVNDQPPPFQPQFVRAKQFVMQDKNWLPRLNGQRLKQAVFDAARTGITDQYNGPSFVDRIIVDPYKSQI